MATRRERRERERAHAKVARDRDRLAKLLPGGSADLPIEIQSASVVEVQARSTPCPLCGGELRLEEHVARPHAGDMLRVARVRCFQCGVARELFFRIRPLM